MNACFRGRPATEPFSLAAMHSGVQEYRSLPPSSDALGDTSENDRKCKILEQLDDDANDPLVSELLLEILHDPNEYDLARVEAIKATGICVDARSPLYTELTAELFRIAADESEDEMLRGWASRYCAFR
ncbi:MAG: hypothetical protein GC162_14220 [Planctomycetes bacterium]|nr:hypothetical protein [Planctomycetota bacterium]